MPSGRSGRAATRREIALVARRFRARPGQDAPRLALAGCGASDRKRSYRRRPYPEVSVASSGSSRKTSTDVFATALWSPASPRPSCPRPPRSPHRIRRRPSGALGDAGAPPVRLPAGNERPLGLGLHAAENDQRVVGSDVRSCLGRPTPKALAVPLHDRCCESPADFGHGPADA